MTSAPSMRDHPLARGAALCCLAALPLGLLMLPQLLAITLGLLSLVRERAREPRRVAAYAIAGALALTVIWGLAGAAILHAVLSK